MPDVTARTLPIALSALLVALSASCVEHAAQRCTSDDECRGARVCSAEGLCTRAALPEDAGAQTDGHADVGADAADPSPDLVVSAAALQFPLPSPTARQRIEWQLLELENRGGAPLQIEAIDVVGSTQFAVRFPAREATGDIREESATPPAQIPAGGQVDARVWFSTRDARPANASLQIRSDDPDEPLVELPLGANADPPCLELPEGDRIVFDPADGTNSQSVSVRNCSQTNTLIVESFRLEQDGGGAIKIDEVNLPQLPARLAPGAVLQTDVLLTSTRDDWNRGIIVVESNDPYQPRVAVDILSDTPGNDCPVANAQAFLPGERFPIPSTPPVAPGSTVRLDGSQSADPDGTIASYQWTILDQPERAQTAFIPSAQVADPTVLLDAPGSYLFELIVRDDQGLADCAAPGQVRLNASNNDIRVELRWRTPADPDPDDDLGADVDLHYLHPEGRWSEAPWDIWADHATADWSRIDRPDASPRLRRADDRAPGPEIIYHATPEFLREFSIGAYYVDDRGMGPSLVTVSLYSDDQLVWESNEAQLTRPGAFWEPVRFVMPGPNIVPTGDFWDGFPPR